MEPLIEANGLKLIKIKSQVEFIDKAITDPLALLLETINVDSFVIAYQDFAVSIGRYQDKKFKFYQNETLESRYLQRIRVFNPSEELLLWRTENGFIGRIRRDGTGNQSFHVIDSQQILFGTKAISINGFTELTEQRGTVLRLPFEGLNVDAEKKRVFIQTRNYIDYNDLNQASYSDCRFVQFGNEENYLD